MEAHLEFSEMPTLSKPRDREHLFLACVQPAAEATEATQCLPLISQGPTLIPLSEAAERGYSGIDIVGSALFNVVEGLLEARDELGLVDIDIPGDAPALRGVVLSAFHKGGSLRDYLPPSQSVMFAPVSGLVLVIDLGRFSGSGQAEVSIRSDGLIGVIGCDAATAREVAEAVVRYGMRTARKAA